MKCPACGRELTNTTVSGVTVDVCSGGCGGIWFDRGELERFDEPSEAAAPELLDVPRDPASRPDLSRRFNCPKDTDTVMMRHYFSVKDAALVDECPACGGYWLDPGELREIRSEFPSEEAKDQAAETLFDNTFGAEIAEQERKSAETLARDRRVAHMLRFICPSYYIPGKQDGAAF